MSLKTFTLCSLTVLCSLFCSSVCDFNVLLLHTNDMHARFQQTDKYSGICGNDSDTSCYGGFARLKSMTVNKIQEAKDKGWPTIYLNAGDTFQGTAYYTFFKWEIARVFVDMLGLQVMSLGNHEFDDGIAGLAPYIGNVSVPVVCANLNTSLEPSMNQPNLTPSVVLDVNGTKVGVIGYLTPDTKLLSNTGKLDILDEITSIRAEAQRLKALGVSILIALGHSGYVKDQEIAKEVEEIDLVVGGHSHTFLYSGTPLPDVEEPLGPYPTVVNQTSGKQVPVVQAYYATKYLGYLELTFDDSGDLKSWNGKPILLSGDLPQDEEVLAVLKPYETQIDSKIKRIIGYTNVLLDNNGMKCKLGECNIGNLITDAYVDYATKQVNSSGWTGAALGLQQAGGIRASINAKTNVNKNGSITVEDLITVLPWDGTVAVIQVNGSTIKDALEFSVHRYEETITGHVSEFLQVSGIHVEYDLNRTSGSRVVSVEVLCADCDVPLYQPLQLNKTYGVVLPQYMEGGGDGFTMLTVDQPTILDKGDYEIVAAYIESHTPVNPGIENRIVLNMSSSASFSMASSFVTICAAVMLYTVI